MLFSLLTQHPEALPSILGRTPTWVWGLLAALIALGVSQMFNRRARFDRVAVLPVAMAGLSVLSLVSALGASGHKPFALLTWLAAAALSAGAAMAWRSSPPAGTRFDPASRRFDRPGSWVPLLLILAIFFTRYSIAIELAMQPGLVHNAGFALALAAVYGLFNGIFTARALRLWRMTALATPTHPGQPTLSA